MMLKATTYLPIQLFPLVCYSVKIIHFLPTVNKPRATSVCFLLPFSPTHTHTHKQNLKHDGLFSDEPPGELKRNYAIIHKTKASFFCLPNIMRIRHKKRIE